MILSALIFTLIDPSCMAVEGSSVFFRLSLSRKIGHQA